MMTKPTGWSCKKCHRSSYYKQKLLCYERLCSKCYIPREEPKTRRVLICDYVSTIQFLIPYWFGHFHLSPCHQCNHPTWQQPCWWCGFYPFGYYGPQDANNFLGKAHWDKQGDLFLNYASCRFSNCASSEHNNYWLDLALDRAKDIEWPNMEDIWFAFGPESDTVQRKKLHPTYNAKYFLRQAEQEVEYFTWCGQEAVADLLRSQRDVEMWKKQLGMGENS